MKYALLVVASGIFFGTTGTSQAFAPANAESLSIGSARIAFGGLLFGLIGLLLWAKDRRSKPSNVSHPHGKWGTALVIAVGAVGVAGFQATFFVGTRVNGVAIGTVLALGSSPLFAGFFEWWALRRRPGLIWWVATAIAVAGLSLLSALGAVGQVEPFGVLLSLSAGAAYAAFVVAMKVLLEQSWHPQDATAMVLSVSSLLGFAMLATTDTSWLRESRGLAVAAWLVIATILVAYPLNIYGLSGLSAATAATLTLAEPATASLLGVLVLGERLTWTGVAGIVAIVFAVALLSFTPKKVTSDASAALLPDEQ